MIHDNNIWSRVCRRENISLAVNSTLHYVCPENHIDTMPLNKADWVRNREPNESRIREALISGTYNFGEYAEMSIWEPKARTIHYHKDWEANILETAVLNVVEPLYQERISKHSFGSLKGRGIKKALDHLRNAVRNNPEAYYLQVDCKKYYQNIDHDSLKESVADLIHDDRAREFIFRLIDSYADGLPIGIPFSQFNGNLHLAPVDDLLETSDDVIDFIRNMDDICVITPDKHSARRVLSSIIEIAGKRGIIIKPNWRISPVARGIDTLGYVIFPTHTRIRKRIKEKMRRNASRLVKANVPDRCFKQKMASHYGWCLHADCRHLLKKILGEKLNLFDMKYKRKSELKPKPLFFGLPKNRFMSIMELIDKEALIIESIIVKIRGVDKIAIRFCLTSDISDDPSDAEISAASRYTITRSSVIMDRLSNDADIFPFAATFKRINNYLCYE